jgi:formylglycine-generating enzyme required for sulfatase activity
MRGNCAQRILRGGGWTNGPESLTSGARHYSKSTDRTVTYGFRVVKDLE